MNTLRVSEPKQTNFGSTLFWKENGNKDYSYIEFPTDDEANEFADVLKAECELVK